MLVIFQSALSILLHTYGHRATPTLMPSQADTNNHELSKRDLKKKKSKHGICIMGQ